MLNMSSSSIRLLSPALREVAETELGETHQSLTEGLNEIKKFLDENSYILARRDDQFFVMFLRGCKYDIKEVKKKIEAYYNVRAQLPDFFKDRDVLNEKFANIVRLGVALPLPDVESEKAPRVMIVRVTSFHPKEFKMEDIIKTIGLVTDILANEDDHIVVAGQVIIADLSNASFQHILHFTPKFIKKLATMSQGGNPLRMRGIHFINLPTGFQTLLNLFKGFFSSDEVPMVTHSSSKSLHKHFSPKILPPEYNGLGASIEEISAIWVTKLKESHEFFREESKYGIDEELKKKILKSEK